MDTNNEKLLFRDEVFQVVGCAIEVLNTLGHGIVEKPYENALVVEFGLRKIPFRQQPGCAWGKINPFPEFYQKVRVDAKYLRWRGELLRARSESEVALQMLRPPALDFLPTLMMYTLSR